MLEGDNLVRVDVRIRLLFEREIGQWLSPFENIVDRFPRNIRYGEMFRRVTGGDKQKRFFIRHPMLVIFLLFLFRGKANFLFYRRLGHDDKSPRLFVRARRGRPGRVLKYQYRCATTIVNIGFFIQKCTSL